jgi:hypothetical protein
MMLEPAAMAGVLVLVLGLWWRLRRRSSPGQSRIPRELKSVRILYSERLFRSEGAEPLVAKVDRTYRSAAGVQVLVELKTRTARRAYASDVIELSAQRLALMAQTGDVVADHGYVLTQHPAGHETGWHRVRLLTHAEVRALVLWREELLAGNAEPQFTHSPGVCRKCAFVRSCQPVWR